MVLFIYVFVSASYCCVINTPPKNSIGQNDKHLLLFTSLWGHQKVLLDTLMHLWSAMGEVAALLISVGFSHVSGALAKRTQFCSAAYLPPAG